MQYTRTVPVIIRLPLDDIRGIPFNPQKVNKLLPKRFKEALKKFEHMQALDVTFIDSLTERPTLKAFYDGKLLKGFEYL